MKRIGKIIILCILMFSSFLTVTAEGEKVTIDTPKVTFDGTQLIMEYDTNAINRALSDMEPGDMLEIIFTVSNTYKDEADIWMENSVLKSFEKNSSASGGAYTYILTYTSSEGEERDLYNSGVVGGQTAENLGLEEVSEGLKDYLILERLPSGKSGTLKLYVELDGETQLNSYQNTKGTLQFRFAAELPKQETKIIYLPHTANRKEDTGDKSKTLSLPLVCFIAADALLVLCAMWLFVRNRKERRA